MAELNLRIYGIDICLDGHNGHCSIESDQQEVCPYCHRASCYRDCDESKSDLDELEDIEETASRRDYNAAVDGIECLILALVSAGCLLNDDKTDFRDREALETAFQSAFQGCADNL